MFDLIPDLKKVKDMFKQLYFVLVIGTALACHAATPKPIQVPGSNNLEPTVQQSVVCKTVAQFVTTYNYKKVELNDSLSTVIFNRYLKSLDENHNYLLAADVSDFNKYKTVLDDDINNGNLNDVFYMFNIFQKRYEERIKYSLAQLDKTFDFTQNELFTYDRDKMPYAASEGDLNADWTKRVKYDMLNLMLANKDVAKNKETLKKRYQTLLTQTTQLDADDLFQIFMDAVTEAVDPHTNYFNPRNAANFNMEMTRQLEGIGATLQAKNEYITIASLVPGGPADKTHQVNTGDRIIGVAQGKDGEFQDIIGWRIENAIKLIRGTKGTLVKLRILPQGKNAGDKSSVVEIVREKIVLQDQLAKEEIRTYNNNGKTIKIGIINVPAFYSDYSAYKAGDANYHTTTRDVKLILDTLKAKGVNGVVIDLREDGGGSLAEAISLSGLFIKTGPVVQVRDTRNQIEVDTDDDPSVAYDGPMAVLVDRFSASASEIFSGAMQDYGRAIIIGTQTYGKGSVQTQIDLDKIISSSLTDKITSAVGGQKKPVSTGSESKYGQLNLTIAKFYRITGNSTQHKGVMPDIQFPSVIPLTKYGEDTEPSAMPFDIIAKSDYTKVGDFTNVIPQLTKMHEQRMSNDASYKYLMEDIADYKKSENEKTVTLNEVQLKKQRDADEQKTFDRDNLRRVALGLKPLKKGEAKPKKEDLDFLKFEAGQILTDYINLDTKITRVNTSGSF
ncbi:MAG TPA: carboxy terminal-processing peptidase [Mucilaginibacter sp.]